MSSAVVRFLFLACLIAFPLDCVPGAKQQRMRPHSHCVVLIFYAPWCHLVKVVVHKGVIREKPTSEEQARAFIRSYADEPATTVGACVCVCLDTGVSYKDVEVNSAEICAIPEQSIDHLIKEGMVFNCAGGVSSLCSQSTFSSVWVVHLCFQIKVHPSDGASFLAVPAQELGPNTYSADVQLWVMCEACAFRLSQPACCGSWGCCLPAGATSAQVDVPLRGRGCHVHNLLSRSSLSHQY